MTLQNPAWRLGGAALGDALASCRERGAGLYWPPTRLWRNW